MLASVRSSDPAGPVGVACGAVAAQHHGRRHLRRRERSRFDRPLRNVARLGRRRSLHGRQRRGDLRRRVRAGRVIGRGGRFVFRRSRRDQHHHIRGCGRHPLRVLGLEPERLRRVAQRRIEHGDELAGGVCRRLGQRTGIVRRSSPARPVRRARRPPRPRPAQRAPRRNSADRRRPPGVRGPARAEAGSATAATPSGSGAGARRWPQHAKGDEPAQTPPGPPQARRASIPGRSPP